MKNLHLKFGLFILVVLGFAETQAQQSITALGGNASGSGGSVSYSIGQVVYITNSGTSGTVAQGVQQPFEVSVVTGVEEARYIGLECSVYPNPTSEFLNLTIGNYTGSNLKYQLYDMNGKLLESEKIKDNLTSICMSHHISAIYFLKITDNNKELKTFKINKN